MAQPENDDARQRARPRPARSRRERSARYPGAGLGESVELCRFLDEHGLDGLGAAEIATALGYRNIKTNTFSARLSAARQFGLLVLENDGYALTPLARAILNEPRPALLTQALLQPPLYAELAERLAGKRVPDAAILANLLEHHHQITASAKQGAAEAFLASARYAGALGDDQVLRLGTDSNGQPAADVSAPSPADVRRRGRGPRSEVRFDLRLWDADRGKVIRVRAPESISPASFERLLQALRLHVRVAEPGPNEQGSGS